MGFIKRLAYLTTGSGVLAGAGWAYYSRDTKFVPWSFTDKDSLASYSSLREFNPSNNPPTCIDHAIRRVPLSQLKTTNQEELTREFCRGVWSGLGFAYQRSYLDKKYRWSEGREKMLWDKSDLTRSEYPLGTQITDHFEVVERTPERVTVRCGDSPLKRGPRASDGIFSMEVDVDEKTNEATFHMKSIFFDSTPEGAAGGSLPWHIDFLHKEYAKLWMETSVRKLMK